MNNDTFIIEGGHSLHGDLYVDGNKNAALPLIAATVLFDTPVTLENIPMIRDVQSLCTALTEMGSQISQPEANTLVIDNSNLDPTRLYKEAWQETRAAILLVGPTLARFGKMRFPAPGGDTIGTRNIDTHLIAFKDMGAAIEIDGMYYTVSVPSGGLHPINLWMREASVTGTENILMTAAMIPGETVIYNAACEPHIQDLANFLVECGVEIEGIGSNRMVIHGNRELKCPPSFKIGYDHTQAASFIVLALCTGSELMVRNGAHHIMPFLTAVEKFNADLQIQGDDVFVPAEQNLRILDNISTGIPKIDTQPWPGFPTDTSSAMVALATQSEGVIMIHEKQFESRLYFTDNLVRMGAKITLCDPHRAIIIGKTPLSGTHLSSPDIRAGITSLIAGLCASGETVISNIAQIDRGYFEIERKLQPLGAQIERR